MKKKFSLLLALVLVVALAVPVFAKTEMEELDNGKFEVTFIWEDDLNASAVNVSGSFNDWQPKHPDWVMEKKDGVWKLTKTLDKGEHNYKFVVHDATGQTWKKDPTAEKFVPDGFGGQNSVLRAISNKLKGEFEVSGVLTDTFEQKGAAAPVSFNNELELRVKGTAFEKQGEEQIERIKYDSKVVLNSDIDEIKDVKESEILSLDEVSIDNLNATYLGNFVDVGVEATTANSAVNSYDYLGIVDADTNNDDRDNTTNPNSRGDARRFKVTANKGLDLTFTSTEYTGDIAGTETDVYLTRLDAKKKLLEDKLEVGSSAVYQKETLIVDGEEQDAAKTATVFGRYNILDNWEVRGEYGYTSAGQLISSLRTAKISEGKWKITLDLSAEDKLDDYEDDIKEVWLGWNNDDTVGPWAPEGEHEGETYKLTKDGDKYTITIDDSVIDGFTPDKFKYKFLLVPEDGVEFEGDAFWPDSYSGGTYYYYPDDEGGNLSLEKSESDVGDNANFGMAETTYKVVDEEASMKARVKAGDYSITKYKGEFTLGTEFKGDNAYLPFADDDFGDNKDSGYQKAYVNAEYDLIKDLTLDGEVLYKYGYADPDNAMNEKVKAGFDWSEPITGLDNVKGHAAYDPAGESDFRAVGPLGDKTYEVQELFAEAETSAVPFTKLIKVNTTQRFDAKVNDYYTEIELDVPVEQVAHVKGHVDYVDTSANDIADENGLKYFVEGKVHHLPAIQDYITHVLVNYEADDNAGFTGDGLVDDPEDDDDNDWKNKLYAETKFMLPEINDVVDGFAWDGVTVKGDFKQLEDGVTSTDDVDDAEEDQKYYVVGDDGGQFVDWYTLAIFETGFDLPLEVRTDLTAKYDLNHGEISEYEDDALFVKVSKQLNMRTTLSASYNKQDEDEGDDYSKLMVETTF